MSTHKTEIQFFDVMDYEKEGEYLTRMHQKGWKFTGIHALFLYRFEKCDPENVRYQLDYNRDGAAHLDEYKQMFADMGWEYLFNFVGYSYFRKPMAEEEDEEIFCDDESRFDMMKRVFMTRMIPMLALFVLFVIPYLCFSVVQLLQNPANGLGMFIPILLITVLYISIFGRYAWKYLAFRKKLGR